MATSEIREGPGWWMASDGGWNPPEMWPEESPPLPGWVRQADGSWTAPVEQRAPAGDDGLRLHLADAADDSAVIDLTTSRPQPLPESAASSAAKIEFQRPANAEARVPEKSPAGDAKPAMRFTLREEAVSTTDVHQERTADRDQRVFAVWLTVAILACIAGLLALLVLL